MATKRRTTTAAGRAAAGAALSVQPGGRPLDRRDRPARSRRGDADRPRPARPGRPDRLVARLDRAVVRDRPLAAAVPAARRRLVRRVGPGQAAELGLGPDARRDRRSPTSGSSARSSSSTSRWRARSAAAAGSDGSWPASGAAAHRARRVRRAARDRDRRADARVQPAPAAGRPARDRDREVGRRRCRGVVRATRSPSGPAKSGPDDGNGTKKGAAVAGAASAKAVTGHRRIAGPDRHLGRRVGRPGRPHPSRRPEHRADVGHVRTCERPVRGRGRVRHDSSRIRRASGERPG